MKKLMLTVFAGMLTFNAYAADFGTAEEAQAMVEKAIAMLEEKGKDAVYEMVNDPNDTEFHDRDLYVFIITHDDKGTFVAHGTKPQLVGKDLIDLKDVKGNPLVRDFIAMVKENDEGWVDYYWPHPITKKVAAKTSFVKKYDDEIFVGVGVYKE